MAESVLTQLARMFDRRVIGTFQRQSLLRLIPSDNIGGIDIIEWAKIWLKKVNQPKMQIAGGNWTAPEDKFDFSSFSIFLYDLQHRITMNKTEMARFAKMNLLPEGTAEIGAEFARKSNYLLFRGKAADDAYPKNNYQYVTAQNASSTDWSNPALKTQATNGAWDAAGQVQLDAADLVGNLEMIGYNPRTSVLFYPEVCSAVFRRPIVTGSSIYGPTPALQAFMDQGIMGAVPVKNELLYTAAGANPTVEAFDVYLVDLSKFLVGYTVPENTEVIPDRLTKITALDTQLTFTPLFIPHEYDEDGYVYKGVSRLTACDANT